jgi:hypothetical protein
VLKLLAAQFFNTAITYYIMVYLTNNPFWSHNGLIMQISSLLTTTAVIQVFTNIFYTSWFTRLIKLKFFYSKNKPINTFQEKINQ